MCKILAVDDEPIVLRVIYTTLERHGYRVKTADSVSNAIELARENDPHMRLLMVNHSICAESGRDAVKAILALQPHLKVLRFSGFLESDLRERGEIGPDSHFIQKPFLSQQLFQKVHEIVGPPIAVSS